MNRSTLIALGVTAAGGLWIASGQFPLDRLTGSDVPAKTVSATPAAHPAKLKIAVRVRQVVAEEWVDEIVLFGRTEANRKVSLRVETSGQVTRHFVRKGDKIEKGGRVLLLAQDDRNARLERAKAALDHATLAYEAANALSQKNFRSTVQVAESKAELERTRAALEEIKLDIARTLIPAPFAGTVERLPLEVGDYARVGDVVAEILELDPIVVAAEIAEKDVARIAVGLPARAALVTGQGVVGKVRYVSRIGGNATRTFRVEVEMPNPDGCLGEGMTAELRLQTGIKKAHRVSPAVLTLSDQGVVGVKIVDENGIVAFRPVELVADLKNGIMIGGLPDHLRLITVGQEFVREGEAVEVSLEAAEARP